MQVQNLYVCGIPFEIMRKDFFSMFGSPGIYCINTTTRFQFNNKSYKPIFLAVLIIALLDIFS
jgi:hypothetical protein